MEFSAFDLRVNPFKNNCCCEESWELGRGSASHPQRDPASRRGNGTGRAGRTLRDGNAPLYLSFPPRRPQHALRMEL